MKVPRLAAQSLNRWLARTERPKAVSLVVCTVTLLAALAGCQSQQTNPGDPFLPFMRTRVPPPGTNVPADSYYPGAPATAAPPASVPPPAGAPMTTPSSMRTAPNDKYSPPGGYNNLPQSSIDRSKVNKLATGEVKAGGTAIARRSLARPAKGQSTVDTQLTAGKVPGAAAAAAAAGAATAGAEETNPADSLAATTPNQDVADATADSSTETGDEQPSGRAAMAFADTPTETEPDADETQHDRADQRMPLASADKRSSDGAAEQSEPVGTSTLRVLGADDRRSGDRDSDAGDAGLIASNDGDLAGRTRDPDNATQFTGQENTLSSFTQELPPSVTWGKTGQPIETTGSTDETTLAMAPSTSAVVQASWNEPPSATRAPAAGSARAGGPPAGAGPTYAYDPSYGWLRGRLEYSAGQRQWKLRYIPIDGATDQFGGSVVLAESATTQGLRAGDFVTAQGRVVGPSQPGRGFSPRYEVASIEPIAGSH